MGLAAHSLSQFRSKLLLFDSERRAVPKLAFSQSFGFKNSENFGFNIAGNGFGDSVLRGCSGFSDNGWRRSWPDCLIAHQPCRHGLFAISAMSGDGAQIPGESNYSEAGSASKSKHPCLCIKGTVPSGKTVRYPGTVVVLGDVEEGGGIVADGDVIVLGRLYGDVHGGQNGDKSAVVYATQLDDCHIRIAEFSALVDMSRFSGCPAIASVLEDGTLGIRAATQKLNDNKEASSSQECFSLSENKTLGAPKSSESTDQGSSKRPAQLALFTGVYISVVGVALLIFPVPLFGALFDVRSVTVGWIRVGAILAVVFGVYYIGTAIGDIRGSSGARAFYLSTVVGRLFLFFGFCWLVAAGAAQPALLLVGLVNMLGAMSMLLALRQDSKSRVVKA